MSRTTALLFAVFVVLSLAAAPAAAQDDVVTVTVSVVDQDGNPVGGATLVVTWNDGAETRERTTASNGRAFVDIPRGADVSIDVESEEYVRNVPYTVNTVEEEEITVDVAEKGTATVEVRDASGQPVENAIVRLWQGGELIVRDRTDADGILETGTIEQGEYTLVTFKEQYLRNRSRVSVTDDVTLARTITRDTVTATFRVHDDHFDPPRPVDDATIQIPELGDTSRTFDGEATTSVPVNDEYDVTITKDGYEETETTLDVEESPLTLNATIQRTPAVTVTPANSRVVVGESVRVTVRNEYEEPLANASVTVDGETVGETDADGELSFTVDSAGEHTIEAEHEGLSGDATIRGVEEGGEEPGTETEPETETETPESDGVGPGFTAATALVAALLVVAALRRRS